MENWNHYSEVFKDRVERYADRAALCAKDGAGWREISWREFGRQAHSIAASLLDAGIGAQETVGIFSPNMPECSICDMAAFLINAVPVYIYPTDTASQAEYIINDASIRVIFVGDQEQYDKVMQILPQSDVISQVVIFKPQVEFAEADNVCTFEDFRRWGAGLKLAGEIASRQAAAGHEDLIRIIYTSGTTGEPKGVMLTHGNVYHQGVAHDRRMGGHLTPDDTDVTLSFLPMSHVFEGIWTYYAFSKGMTNYYLEEPNQIIDFIQEVRPTIMCAVPRFYEKIYATVHHKLETVAPYHKRLLFKWAISVGRQHNNRRKDRLFISRWLKVKYNVADRLILSKIRDAVGGRIKFFPCGGAPLAAEIEEFFYAAGLHVAYGYGLSETTATACGHEVDGYTFGAVGKPMPGLEMKIDDNGEILMRGKTVMKGYYNKPRETAEVFTEDGYFRSGDAGFFDENGELWITDRIKDLMKTSGGKYIAPQKIESLLGADHFIEQIAVIADRRNYVSALIVPAFEVLAEHVQSLNIKVSDAAELIGHPGVVEFYRERIDALSGELARYERIKRFVLLEHEFSQERGEVTPTMKVKRRVVNRNYADQIEAMYA